MSGTWFARSSTISTIVTRIYYTIKPTFPSAALNRRSALWEFPVYNTNAYLLFTMTAAVLFICITVGIHWIPTVIYAITFVFSLAAIGLYMQRHR